MGQQKMSIDYATFQFRGAVRGMAVGEGDVRARLRGAYNVIYPVRPSELPPPLDAHLAWIIAELTKREARHPWEGTVEATLAQIRRSTGRKIAERILVIAHALEILVPSGRHRI